MKKSNGYIDPLAVVLVAVLVVLLSLLVWGGIATLVQNSKFERWQGDCREAKGLVVKLSETRYECFIDNKKVVLPGWESEQ